MLDSDRVGELSQVHGLETMAIDKPYAGLANRRLCAGPGGAFGTRHFPGFSVERFRAIAIMPINLIVHLGLGRDRLLTPCNAAMPILPHCAARNLDPRVKREGDSKEYGAVVLPNAIALYDHMLLRYKNV